LCRKRAAADDDDDPPAASRASAMRVALFHSTRPGPTIGFRGRQSPDYHGDKLWTTMTLAPSCTSAPRAIRLSSKHWLFVFESRRSYGGKFVSPKATIDVRVRRLRMTNPLKLIRPNLAFSVLRPGNYKIDVNEAGDTTVVVVRDGQGEVHRWWLCLHHSSS